MKKSTNFLIFLVFMVLSVSVNAQQLIQKYQPLKKDSVKIGNGPNDYLLFIQQGYTLKLPKSKTIQGVLILLEDSKFDDKNRSAKQLYVDASKYGFAVLSVSTAIPLDFFFSNSSINEAHRVIQNVFQKHQLPNKNVFFLGTSLVGHRAMRYVQFLRTNALDFKPNITGLVICNFTLDFTRKWYQHERDIRINRINLSEPKLMNYLLEANLRGTPKTNPESYHRFSAYSYFDKENRNIKHYKDLAIRAYIEPAIKYKLTNQARTLYENNATDIVAFLAELDLAGNKNTDLVVLHPDDNPSPKKTTQATWDAINKQELMTWIVKQTQK